jgi:23S rRNA pseudouridine1911/1915/1917 synthase
MQVSDLKIIYEDNHIIAVNKPSGMLVQGDKTGDETLGDVVKKYLKEKYQKPGDVYLGVTHRIDRPVSGVLLFARTSKALTRLNELFKSRDMKKTYWAIVQNRPAKEEDTLTHWLKKNEAKNMSKAFAKETDGALKCSLDYKLISSIDNYHLLEINPHTGRHHQIRVQLAAIGSPIKGDLKYGSKRSNKDGSISLHARKINFEHPVKKEPIEIIAEVPEDVVWRAFKV